MSRVSSSSDRLKRRSSVSSGASSNVSGVRSSWLMLAKKRLLIWSNSRSFWLLSSRAFRFSSSSKRRAEFAEAQAIEEVVAGDDRDSRQHQEVKVIGDHVQTVKGPLGRQAREYIRSTLRNANRDSRTLQCTTTLTASRIRFSPA